MCEIQELTGQVIILKVIGCDEVPLTLTIAGKVTYVKGNRVGVHNRVWVGEFSTLPDTQVVKRELGDSGDFEYDLHTAQFADRMVADAG